MVFFFFFKQKTAYEMVANGATVQDLSEVYLSTLRQQFGKAVAVADEFRWEWLTIPHIFGSPFYCYAYSLASLLVLALYHRTKHNGPPFRPKYLDLPAPGGRRARAASR